MEQTAPRYLFRECVTPNCSVMIGWVVGSLQGVTTCKWCQSGTAYYADGSLQRNRERYGGQL